MDYEAKAREAAETVFDRLRPFIADNRTTMMRDMMFDTIAAAIREAVEGRDALINDLAYFIEGMAELGLIDEDLLHSENDCDGECGHRVCEYGGCLPWRMARVRALSAGKEQPPA